MQFSEPLKSGKLKKRYKRFFADIELDNGDTITLHCPNTGSMKGCNIPDRTVWYSTSDNKKRKLPYTWEMIEVEDNVLVGVNTHRANHLVEEAVKAGVISELEQYDNIRREVRYGVENSRIDLLLESPEQNCYVEVKNVTLGGDKGQGYFPDSVTTRGQKHLRELMQIVKEGHRAVLLFCVQHSGIDQVSPADHIDEEYGQILREAMTAGVEILAYRASLSPEAITLSQKIPVAVS